MGTVAEDIYPFRSPGSLQLGVAAAAVAASATTMPTPTALITHVSGTAALQLIPLPYAGFTGSIKYIPDAAFTGVTTGTATDTNRAIGLAFTAVTGKVLELTYDGVKWYPSYVS